MGEGVSPGGGWEEWRWLLAALNLTALGLFVVVVRAWGRHGRRRRLMISGSVSVVAIVLAYGAAVRPSAIPIDWITILHEGLGLKMILHLYMRAVHAGMNYTFVIAAVAAGSMPTPHDAVWLNLLLALVNAAIFLLIALYVVGPLWAVVWTLVFALNPAMFLAAFSELPTQLLALYFLAGVIAWGVLDDPLPQPWPARAAAAALCAVLTSLAALTRPEVALIGIVALGLRVAQWLLPPEWWPRAASRLRAGWERLLELLADRPGVVALLALAGAIVARTGMPWGLGGRSEWAGLYPFNPSIFSLFFFLPMLLLPVAVSVAVLVGCIDAGLRFRRFGGLALSLFVLVRMYFAAQNQYYETGRYLSYVLPAVVLLGVFGTHRLASLVAGWPAGARRLARVLFIVAWFTPALPGAPDFYLRPAYHRDGGFAQALLDLNVQREVRHLLAMTEQNPECVFIGRVISSHARPDDPWEYAYVVFGTPIPEPIVVAETDATIEEVIARHTGGAGCVRLYYGGDCNLIGADGCAAFIAGRRQIDELRFWSRPYNNPHQFGYAAPEVVLATYAWP